MQINQGNNLPRVKVSNQSAIKKMIYNYGPIMRSEISDGLSLTLPTITTNINSMITCGIVQEISNPDTTQKTIGRKANPVNIVDDSHFFIGIEMRRNTRYICITNYRGKIVYSSSDNAYYGDYDENIRQIGLMIIQAIHSGIVSESQIFGIGVCMPGIVNRDEGKLAIHHQYNWYNKDVCNDIKEFAHFKGPVTLENDACARAYGVQLFQREYLNDVPSFSYLFISSGISCPMILSGPGFISSPLGTGEIGYMIMDASKPRNNFGSTGNLSSLSGERSVIERSMKAIKDGKAPILKALCNDEKPTMEQVMKTFEEGDESVSQIISESVKYLGIAIANIDNFVHPERILLDAMIFSNKKNRDLFIETVSENSVRPISETERFIFIDHSNIINGARGAAAVAIRTDLETYIE